MITVGDLVGFEESKDAVMSFVSSFMAKYHIHEFLVKTDGNGNYQGSFDFDKKMP